MRTLRRILVAAVGGTVLLIGVVLILFPGPAFIVIPIGLGILALEFTWARKIFTAGRSLFRKKEKNLS